MQRVSDGRAGGAAKLDEMFTMFPAEIEELVISLAESNAVDSVMAAMTIQCAGRPWPRETPASG